MEELSVTCTHFWRNDTGIPVYSSSPQTFSSPQASILEIGNFQHVRINMAARRNSARPAVQVSDTACLVSRRTLLATALTSAILGLPALTPLVAAQASDPLQDWLRANTSPIRTVDPFDEDFSDLEPLVALIGDAQVVQLGEPSHGAGTAFMAKTRLVKFLHQRMGFDILAWESGFYDVERTQAGLRAGGDVITSAQRGVFSIWSASEECRPLFEYAKQSQASTHPLVMVGFDMQFTSAGAFADFSIELRSYTGALRDSALRNEATQAAGKALDGFSGFDAYLAAVSSGAGNTPSRPGLAALEQLHEAADQLTVLFNEHRQAFDEISGERRREFMTHAMANLAGYGTNLYERFGADFQAGPDAVVIGENRRDALNARNLRWLISKGYPGQKVIIWAHNAHVMNAYYEAPNFKTVSLDPVPNSMKTSGVFLAEWLGESLYTIGFTAYEGEDGIIGNPVSAIAPAREGSLEERLNRLGLNYAYLDLRSVRGQAGHPLLQLQTMRVPKYDDVDIADPTRPFDAVFYIARMEPASLVQRLDHQD